MPDGDLVGDLTRGLVWRAEDDEGFGEVVLRFDITLGGSDFLPFEMPRKENMIPPELAERCFFCLAV